MIRWFSVRRLLVWTVLASSFLLVMVWLGRAIYRDATSEGRRGHSVIASRKARLQYKQDLQNRPKAAGPNPTREVEHDRLFSGPKHEHAVDESKDPKSKEDLDSDDSPLKPIPLVIPEQSINVPVSSIMGTKWAAPFALRNSSDLRSAWETYLQYRQTNPDGTMEAYLWDTFGVVTLPAGGKDLARAEKTPPPSIPKSSVGSKYERLRFEFSIKRHVALLYGDYLIRGGQETRHFGIPVCRTIGLASDGSMRSQPFKTKELERLEGSQGSLAFVDINYVGPDGKPLPWITRHGSLGGKLRLVVKDFAAPKKRRHHTSKEGGSRDHSPKQGHGPKDRRTTSDMKIFGKEHHALASIHHPGVIQPVCYERNPRLQMIYPFLAGGDLVTLSSDHLAYKDTVTGKLLTPDDTFLPRFFRQLVEAVHAVHAAGILHLDLKPENLVIHGPNRHFVLPADHHALSAYHLVLLDFGLAMRLEDARQRDCLHVGTDVTMAPEQVLCNHGGDRGTDWWGLAAAMWRTRVFWEPSIKEDERTRLLNAKCEQWGHPILPAQPWFSAEFRALMRAMLKPTPRERDFSRNHRRLQRLLDHPYLLRGLDLESRGRRLRELGVTRLEDLSLSLELTDSESEENASPEAEPTHDTEEVSFDTSQ